MDKQENAVVEVEKMMPKLLKAQEEFPPITMDAEVNSGTYKFKYATLGHILDLVNPVLHKYGLVIWQRFNGNNLETILSDSVTDKSISSTIPLALEGQKPQMQGAIISYFRRYSITCLLNLSTESDTDASDAPIRDLKPIASKETVKPSKPMQEAVHRAKEVFSAKAESPAKSESNLDDNRMHFRGRVKVAEVSEKVNKKTQKPFKAYSILLDNSKTWMSTLSSTIGEELVHAKDSGDEVEIICVQNGDFVNIVELAHIEKNIPERQEPSSDDHDAETTPF